MADRASCRGCGPVVGVLGCRPKPRDSSGPTSGPRFRGQLRAAVCLAMALLIQSFDACCAEFLSQRRDHMDRGYNDQVKHTFSIDTYADAVKYLNKYGYLNCTIPQTRRQHLPTDIKKRPEVSISEGYVCKDWEVRKAVLVLQANFNIKKTGRLDEKTITTMSQRRCGNSDMTKTQTTSTVDRRLQDNAVGMQGAGQRRRRWPRKVQRSYEGQGLRSRRSVQATADLVFPKSEDRAIRGPYDLEPVEYVETNALERRKQMLEEIRNRLKATQTERDERPLAERILAKRISRSKVTRRIRRKRLSTKILSRDGNLTGEEADKEGREPRDKLDKDENNPVLWRLLSEEMSRRIPFIYQRAILELAVRMWSEVIPLRFIEDNEGDLDSIDIIFAFGRESHMSCHRPFDGSGGELAHSLSDGDIHFDDDENYHADGTGINLLKVAVHEVGHVLGLVHNDKRHSVMYAIYISTPSNEDFELMHEDREAVQRLYGVCKGGFDVIFDWVRTYRHHATNQLQYIYNTHFFRRNNYWMYENRWNRTKYGDPRHIDRDWRGLPSNLDGYVQTVMNKGSTFEIQTYFFKGDIYYKYDDVEDKVMDGYPRRIAEDFGPRHGYDISIPNDIDTVWFHETIPNKPTLYFFKGDWVWLYDAREIGRNACCDAKRRFTELFPMIGPTSLDPLDTLTGDIDTVYYSFASRQTYFFKDELVYGLVFNYSGSTPGQLPQWGLRKLWPWYNFWHNICEVE